MDRDRPPSARRAMTSRGTWIAIAVTGLVIAAVTAIAFDSARRDRAALVDAFANEHLVRLRIAVREIESELDAVRQHLEFAARLVDATDSGRDQKRELDALLTVVRNYRLIIVYDLEGHERVVATDRGGAATSSSVPWAEPLRDVARAAIAGQALSISEPLGDAASPWFRAFGMPLSRNGRVRGAVVILVDQKGTFERLRLVAPERTARLLLLGPYGHPAPLTDPAVAPTLAEPRGGALAEAVRRMRAGQTGSVTLPAAEASEIGAGTADAIVAFAPIRTGDSSHWSVAIIDSTGALQSQEDAIVLRMALFAVGLALALGSLSVYLVLSARRAISVQERLRTAEEVARVREKAERMLENVPVAVVALDDAGRISALNVASRERIPSAAIGQPLEHALPGATPETLNELHELVATARRSGTVQRRIAQRIPISGREHHFSVHAVPLAHPMPDITMLVVLEDVTELNTLSAQLLRAEKLATVGVLAAGIAHEVGTPLGVVRGRAEMLMNKVGAGTPLGAHAHVMIDEIDRISRTIQELLDFSRLSRAPAAAVPLEAVASNVVELLAFEARTRNVSMDVDVADGLAVVANADQLKQVLVNVAMNAIHACSRGGHVTIRARSGEDGSQALIEVIDDGSGIPEALRHRVFDPFFTTKKRGKGTGLGLTVAAQIVRSHGGEVDIESAVGSGTCVRMRWPLAAAEETDGEALRRAHSGRR